jgi:hypothetical protein
LNEKHPEEFGSKKSKTFYNKTFTRTKSFNANFGEKDKWFKTNKDNFYNQGAIEKVDYHQDVKFIYKLKKITTNSNFHIKSRPILFIENKLNKNKVMELEK